ncbi:MAG: 30S ribosomal protein S13 [Planctomycetes bacterium]|nr:30S ribosomal protein S13 [Planctomycetota bacterium]
MPRLLGVDIPNNKPLWISLQSIYGVGRKVALDVCGELQLDPQRRAHTLNADEITSLTNILEGQYTVEGNLRRQRAQNINRLKDIKCYRGHRHRVSLPVRGQRSRTNARTRKGPRKTIAGKKLATK